MSDNQNREHDGRKTNAICHSLHFNTPILNPSSSKIEAIPAMANENAIANNTLKNASIMQADDYQD